MFRGLGPSISPLGGRGVPSQTPVSVKVTTLEDEVPGIQSCNVLDVNRRTVRRQAEARPIVHQDSLNPSEEVDTDNLLTRAELVITLSG